MILYGGGSGHPFEETSKALAALLAELDIAADLSMDIEAGLQAAGDYDLLAVNALRWTMTQHEKYAADRPRWGLDLSLAGRAAFQAHLDRGRPLFAMHTASICFDTWPGWRDIVGGAWVWGRSHHPAKGPVRVRIDRSAGALADGLADFNVDDEVYYGLDLLPDIRVLANADAGQGFQPFVWTHQAGRGRVFYDGLGHDVRSIETPGHRALLLRGLGWLLPHNGERQGQ